MVHAGLVRILGVVLHPGGAFEIGQSRAVIGGQREGDERGLGVHRKDADVHGGLMPPEALCRWGAGLGEFRALDAHAERPRI